MGKQATKHTNGLLKDRALGGAGTDATHGGNRSDAEPLGCTREAEFDAYISARIISQQQNRRRIERKTDAALQREDTESGAGQVGRAGGSRPMGNEEAHLSGLSNVEVCAYDFGRDLRDAEIGNGSLEDSRVISHYAEHVIAAPAKQATDSTGRMVVIDMENRIELLRLGRLADRAAPILGRA